MNALGRTLLGSTTVAGLAALAPLSFDPGAAARGAAPIRLVSACAQTTNDCNPATNYVCIRPYGYLVNQICAAGCGS